MPTSTLRRTCRALALAAASLLTLAQAHAASPPTRVTLGVLNDRAGPYSDLAGDGSVVAAEMAAADFKAQNSGFDIRVLSADHQNKPDIGAGIVRQWIDRDDLDVVLDVPFSSVALAVHQIVREKNRLMINSGAGASEITGALCSPNTIHWTYDTWALANGTGGAMVRSGGDTWFFITADYAFGKALERDVSEVVERNGGKVLGSVRHPVAATDYSSFLIQAQGSKAKVIGLANAGSDTINTIKQGAEFGVAEGGQRLAGLLVFLSDVHSLGLKVAQGLVLTEAFYWDLNDGTRAWSRRFAERHKGRMPTMVQAGVYAGMMHYLKAVKATGSKDPATVTAEMRRVPAEDPLFGRSEVRPDGRVTHPMYLFEVKKPSESKGPWDYYRLVSTIPADQAFRPLQAGNCPLVTK
ncbi:amino acid/amide ABC transporter substrate-binding protein, HAAT family [Methylobacterium sp. 174MFSha1.1]|uniref:ABC transporter substrate-binding protein n=1 Tax=Methylobacterium sp. 174MFSha1.1 TaxID=1502749 RepID=UPI0008EC4280|nr:ABC transporter substrate-binding protein [Methylobacterium sp. 174MFSha1.1]SFV15379.1 amino acid/amide ABC transporter substrate-binding protein, HAAT family [Methylobacterium sp. 174MFSha1.1]